MNRENDSRIIEKIFSFGLWRLVPSIESTNCAKAMRIEAENRFKNG